MKTNYPFSVWNIDGFGGGIILGWQHSSPSQPKFTQPRVLATCKTVISSFPIVSFLEICKQNHSIKQYGFQQSFISTSKVNSRNWNSRIFYLFGKCKIMPTKTKEFLSVTWIGILEYSLVSNIHWSNRTSAVFHQVDNRHYKTFMNMQTRKALNLYDEAEYVSGFVALC